MSNPAGETQTTEAEKDLVKKFGVEPTAVPDTSVHKRDAGQAKPEVNSAAEAGHVGDMQV
jgi:hypothetical protein